MSKTITTGGRRYLEDGVWHDDNGPIPGYPDQWQPPMTDAEVEAAALDDPDCQPTPPGGPARRVSLARFTRQKLGMSSEEFAAAYGIPLDTLRAWERHEAEPTPAEMSLLRAIATAPDAVRAALKEPA